MTAAHLHIAYMLTLDNYYKAVAKASETYSTEDRIAEAVAYGYCDCTYTFLYLTAEAEWKQTILQEA